MLAPSPPKGLSDPQRHLSTPPTDILPVPPASSACSSQLALPNSRLSLESVGGAPCFIPPCFMRGAADLPAPCGSSSPPDFPAPHAQHPPPPTPFVHSSYPQECGSVGGAPCIIRRAVDLPAPLGPSRPNDSLAPTCKYRSCTATLGGDDPSCVGSVNGQLVCLGRQAVCSWRCCNEGVSSAGNVQTAWA